jgi:hypothetical protein
MPPSTTSKPQSLYAQLGDAIQPEWRTSQEFVPFRFDKLPIELRLKIWGMAAPEPAFIVQVPRGKAGKGYTYTRAVPAVLHACRESRNEYLDPGLSECQESVNRRRKVHPVYKLSFHSSDGSREAPVYFSSDIDTFCGLPENPQESSLQEMIEVGDQCTVCTGIGK